jgi:hypothetical protein
MALGDVYILLGLLLSGIVVAVSIDAVCLRRWIRWQAWRVCWYNCAQVWRWCGFLFMLFYCCGVVVGMVVAVGWMVCLVVVAGVVVVVVVVAVVVAVVVVVVLTGGIAVAAVVLLVIVVAASVAHIPRSGTVWYSDDILLHRKLCRLEHRPSLW